MDETKAFARKTSGLIRQASIFDTFTYNSAASSFVAVLFFYTWVITFAPGGNFLSGIPLSLISFSIAITYSMLVATFPRSGGDYIFNSRVLHPSLGFAFNFSLVFWQSFFLAFTYYLVWLSGIGPGLHILGYLTKNPALINAGLALMDPFNAFLLGTILNVVFTCIALAGTKKLLIANNVIWLVSIIGLVVAIGAMAVVSHLSFIQLFNSFMSAYGGKYGATQNPYNAVIEGAKTLGYTVPPFTFAWPYVALSSSAVIWTFYSAYIAGEIKGADSIKRNLVSMAGAGIFNVFLMAFFFYYMFRTFGYEFLASISSLCSINSEGLPWVYATEMVTAFCGLVAQNPFLAAIAVAGISFAGTLIFVVVLYLQISRNIFAWSIDRLMPDKMADVHPRLHTPIYVNIAMLTIIESFLIALLAFPDAFWTIYASTIIGPAFSCMFLPGITGALLPYRRRDIYEVSPAKREIAGIPLITIFGTVQAAYMIFMVYEYVSWPEFGISAPIPLFLNFGMIILGFIFYWIIRALRKAQGIDIDLAFKEIPPL